MDSARTKTGFGIDDFIGDKREDLRRLAAQHNVHNLRIFGSVARDEARSDSDIDLLVDGLENASWGGGGLLVAIEALLGRRVNLVSEEDLHPLIRRQVLAEAQPL